MPAVKLNWQTAEVKDGELTVELENELPEGWKQSFESTAKLLGSGGWGEVELNESTVRVGDVSDGDAEKLRHYLESVVDQANADTGAAEEQSETDDEDREQDDQDDRDDEDAELTSRFREFGHEQRDDRDDADVTDKDE